MITVQQVESIFKRTFYKDYKTLLVGGAKEPLYQPSCNGDNLLYYRSHFINSALHEVAHWCIAGEKRRKMVDFGYHYTPDGRGESEQKAFEQVEVKPQAFEWIFSTAAGVSFLPSADNLEAGIGPSTDFKKRIAQVATSLVDTQRGTISHPRANLFLQNLLEESQRRESFSSVWDSMPLRGIDDLFPL